MHGLTVMFAVCSSCLDGSLWLFVCCPPFLYFHYFIRYKGTELFQNDKHSKEIICHFRKIEFLEQYAVRRFPRKKGDLHVVKDDD